MAQLREVKVTFENDNVIHTSMAAHLEDDDILEYYKKGRQFNLGSSAQDILTKVKEVAIIK